MTSSGTTNDNEWYNEWQRVATSGAASDSERQQITKSNTKWQRVKANDSEW